MTMVERVAAAIWALNEHTDCPEYAQLNRDAKARADSMARAAIEAMREPTEEMFKATRDAHGYDGLAAWSAMIDAALNEKPT